MNSKGCGWFFSPYAILEHVLYLVREKKTRNGIKRKGAQPEGVFMCNLLFRSFGSTQAETAGPPVPCLTKYKYFYPAIPLCLFCHV
jgi:hypothetical protein